MQSTQHSIAAQSDLSMIPELTEIPAETRGWILYDGRCPICRKGVRRLGRIATTRGYRITPMQRRWVQERLARRTQPVPDEMLLLLPHDRLLAGVDAYLHLAARIWWATPVVAIAAVPGAKFVFRTLYAWFAAHRFELSRVCGANSCTTCRVGE